MALLTPAQTKQPGEALSVDIDYTKFIKDRTVESITPTITTPAGLTLVVSLMNANVLQLHVAGGMAGQSYKWTISTAIVISGVTHVVEDEFFTLVEEV
jgi:hypothetical protein